MKKRLAFVLLAFAACQSKNTTTTTPTADGEKITIAPPIPTLDVPFQKLEADPSKDTDWKLPNGTHIAIPANSIVQADGSPAGGKVELSYREMHDAADILLSGIPMEYTAQGETRTMQTAGMFELRAQQDGKPLDIAPHATIKVRLASYEKGDDYSFFHLDENKGWEFLDYGGKPEINTQKTQSTVKKPAHAFPLSNEYFCFNYMSILDVLYNDNYTDIQNNENNPEWGAKAKSYGLSWLNVFGHPPVEYEGVRHPSALMLWKRLSSKPFPNWFAKDGQYDGFQLTKVKGNIYTIASTSKDGTQQFSAQIELVMPLKALFKFAPSYWEKNYEAGMEKVREEERRLKLQADAFRTFEVSGFGIYNYDKLMNENDAVQVVAKFNAPKQNNELYDLDFVFYLPEDNKTVVKMPRGDWDKMTLLPNNAARFLTILPDGGIGLYAASEYRKINFDALRTQSKPGYTFDLVKTADKLTSADELRELLDII